MAGSTSGKSRFSLLLLEDGEVLLSDLAVQYRFFADTSVGSALHPLQSYPQRFVGRSAKSSFRGRIKIGTKSIFFDSDDWRDPIIRIPLSSVDSARPTRDTSRSRCSEDSLSRSSLLEDVDDENSVLIVANKAVFQRELGSDHPYVDVQLKGKHIFTPLYSSPLHLLDEIATLLRITEALPRRKRDQQLRDLVQERESRVPFDITLLEHGVKENAIMDSAASAVYTLSRAPGRFRITAQNVYFMPIHGESTQAVERIPTRNIKTIRRLRHGCHNSALEIGFEDCPSTGTALPFYTFMVSFESFKVREKAVNFLLKVVKHHVEMFDRRELEMALNKWRRGQISNFDYLMYLNMAAGRSFNDLSQYPVFPWILKDYNSDLLDLSNETTFRDLSRPIGALDPQRLEVLQQRYADMAPPRFFYGTHYSTPAYTINYLVRAAPAAMLRLQNGRFDTPDRLFNSLADTWAGVMKNQGDVKELIPEFYATDFSRGNASGIISSKASPGEFLDNVLGLDLGTKQDGKRVDDVELPPWANGSSELFIRRHREALESVLVSSKLHSWIDLIFGVRSRSADACNVFYTDVALPGSLEPSESSKLTAEEMAQIETVYLEFGRTPERLFGHPHPPKFGDIELVDSSSEGASQDIMRKDGVLGNPGSRSGQVQREEEHGNGINSAPMSNTDAALPSPHAKESPRVSSSAPASWGSHSRRRDSVLAGASEHILVSFEPPPLETGLQGSRQVPSHCISTVIDGTENSTASSEIIDTSLITLAQLRQDDFISGLEGTGAGTTIFCTIWSDGYLRVHGETGILRSKHIGDARSVVYISPGMVAFGTLAGTIGMYHIETGRTEEVQAAAHDAEVNALEYMDICGVLISGSKDASVKAWRFERDNRRLSSLRLLQELDAESSVVDISCFMETLVHPQEEGDGASQLLVAVSTLDGILLAWEVDTSCEDLDFLEPVWRSEKRPVEANMTTSLRRAHRVSWLYQGKTRRPALVSVHTNENCMRVWSLNETNMASAEVFLTDRGALSITGCDESRTVLVGGENGQITEFDSTGLCLGKVTAGEDDVRNTLLPNSEACIYVLSGARQVLRVKR